MEVDDWTKLSSLNITSPVETQFFIDILVTNPNICVLSYSQPRKT